MTDTEQRIAEANRRLGELRSVEQNKLMWALLADFANQVQWPVNGVLTRISPQDFKDIFSAALGKHNRIAQGIDGGFVFLGMRTSKMNKEQMTELLEFILAEGTTRGVKWTDDPQ